MQLSISDIIVKIIYMQFKTLKHKTLADTYGHIIEAKIPSKFEIAHSTIPELKPITLTLELFIDYWKKYDQLIVIEQLQDYDLVTVYVSQALPSFLVGEFGNKMMDSLRSATNMKTWRQIEASLHHALEDPFEYISQYIPQYIMIDGREFVLNIFMNHAHRDFRVCFEANDDSGEFKFLYENASNSIEFLENLKELRRDLERNDLLDDLYKGDGYTIAIYEKHLNGDNNSE